MSETKIIGTVGRMWADTTYSSFTDSLVDLMQFSQMALCKQGEMVQYDHATVSWHQMGRNQLVTQMQGDWLLQLDTDHVFGPDLLARLLYLSKKHDLPVLSGIYQYKNPPHGPVAGMWTGDKRITSLVSWPKEEEVLEVGVVGAGALLVQKKVFDRITKELKQEPFEIIPGLSEDYSFCYRCKQLGIPVGLAVNVQCHHQIRTTLDMADYYPDQALMKVSSKMGELCLKG